MYLSRIHIRNFRQFGDDESSLQVSFNEGVTALVGRNDSGKTAVIDAIRYALLTRGQDFLRIQPEDFHIRSDGKQADQIQIRCTLSGLSTDEKGAFAEYLSFDANNVSLVISLTARRLSESPGVRRWLDVSVRCGIDGTGPTIESSVRDLLASTYLRPLRDAEREMSPGRGSRLSQILANVPEINSGAPFIETAPVADVAELKNLSLVGLADYLRHVVSQHSGIDSAQNAINAQYLSFLSLSGDSLKGKIDFSEGGNEKARLRQLLERLELCLLESTSGSARGRYGLGSNNLLYMACELLLLGREPEGLPLLLIEEPEAHLHPQRQLRLMEFLSKAACKVEGEALRPVQVILTTHSPNLASNISLQNIIILQGGRSFSLAPEKTELELGDYRFLQRFLDVTKANLFFAHGVIIVEGDAEAILLPVIAKLLDADLTEQGVSIVNVGSTGLRRYSRIFQRADKTELPLSVPIACLADMDVMPDCAPQELGIVEDENDAKWNSAKRRWKARKDFGADRKSQDIELAKYRNRLQSDDGQMVKTFVSDHWTLEYDLAYCGLDEEVALATSLAICDEAITAVKKSELEVKKDAIQEFATLKAQVGDDRELLATRIFIPLHSRRASKTIVAQYLADILLDQSKQVGFDKSAFERKLPRYIVEAIAYVRSAAQAAAPSSDAREMENA